LKRAQLSTSHYPIVDCGRIYCYYFFNEKLNKEERMAISYVAVVGLENVGSYPNFAEAFKAFFHTVKDLARKGDDLAGR